MNLLAFAGGVGGAKLADGLTRAVGAEQLNVIVNTADDFILYGLHISPDVDTVMYTLAGLANAETGWGLAGDTWQNFDMLERYGMAPWFHLGDQDMATHLLRTQMMNDGATLSEVTRKLCKQLRIDVQVLPMSDDPVSTLVDTADGPMHFQEYFVKHRWQPVVRGLVYEGAQEAEPAPGMLRRIETADTIIICPSNPYLSIEPIFSLRGVRDVLLNATAPIIAVSPIIAGEAVKGPAAKLMKELGKEASAVEVARHYSDFINGFVLDEQDAALRPQIEAMGIGVLVTDTIMRNTDDRHRLGCDVVTFADELRPEKLGGCKLP